jgi:hypothetical protein
LFPPARNRGNAFLLKTFFFAFGFQKGDFSRRFAKNFARRFKIFLPAKRELLFFSGAELWHWNCISRRKAETDQSPPA